MKNLKKLTMAILAGAMALTATCVSAFAEEDVVLSVLSENGTVVDYTQSEVDELGGIVPAYGGITVELYSNIDTLSILRAARSTGSFTSTSIPGTSGKYNIYNASYEGNFNIPSGSYRYSNRRLYTDTSSGATTSNVFIQVYGSKDSDGNYNHDFENKLKAILYVPEVSGNIPFAQLAVSTNISATYRNMDIDYTYYVRMQNDSNYQATGTTTIAAY